MMNKFLLLPLILVGCTAPVTDPPAHACSPRLDGKPTHCPDTLGEIKLPRTEVTVSYTHLTLPTNDQV